MKTSTVQGARPLAVVKTAETPKWLPLKQVRTLTMEKGSSEGRLPHVSSASGLVKIGEKVFVAGDDELSLASFHGDRKGEWVPALAGTLPLDRAERKAAKNDFESLTVLPPFRGAEHGGLFAVTSGSAPNRSKAAFVPLTADGLPGKPVEIDLGPLMQSLAKRIPELNLEGAVVSGGSLKLLHRGGEDGGNTLIDVDLHGLSEAIASGQVPGENLVKQLTHFELGMLGGVALGFSDAAALPDGSIVFTASAEETDNPILDGAVTGSVIGFIGRDGKLGATWPVKDVKLEGVHAEVKGDDVHVLLVADADDPAIASPLLSAVLAGAAPKGARQAPVTNAFDGAVKTVSAPDAKGFTAAVKSARDTGWSTAVSSSAAQDVRRAQAELRHFAKLVDQGGLRPELIRVAPFEPGAPESQWQTANGKVVWQLHTANGQIPPGLKTLAAELGVTDLAAGSVEGAAPIAEVKDVSPQAAFGRAMKLADQLFGAAGGDPKAPDFALFRYTVGRYLLNATSPQALAYLAEHYTGDTKGLLATGQVPERWVEKLERGFKKPYTNDAALQWLNQMAAKLTDLAAFVDENNPKGSPVTFFTAGSTTKARWSVGSDLDVLIDTPDKELMKKVLEGPFGFYGTADKEEFAVLNASFYWDRGRFFGTPIELAKGTKALTPDTVEKVFKETSKTSWGVEWRSTPEGSRLEIGAGAAEKFVREAPAVTEQLYDYSRPTRAQLDTKWVTEHWEGVVKTAPELRQLGRQRFVDEGEALVKALLPQALSEQNVARFFAEAGLPVPAPGADLAALIPPLQMDEFLGLKDAAERVFVDFASAQRVKVAAEGGLPSAWGEVFAAAR